MENAADRRKINFKSLLTANAGRVDNVLLRKTLRPFGVFVAWIALRLGMLPIAVTYLSFFIGLTGCVLFIFGYSISGVIMVLLWQGLDTADGTMARRLGITSNYGGFIDYLGGMFVLAFLDVSVGLGVMRIPGESLNRFFSLFGLSVSINPVWFFVMGAYSSICAILMRLIIKIAHIRFGNDVENINDVEFGKKSIIGWIISQIKYIERLGGYHIIILAIASLLHGLEVYLAFYFVFYLFFLAAFICRVFFLFRQHHEYL